MSERRANAAQSRWVAIAVAVAAIAGCGGAGDGSENAGENEVSPAPSPVASSVSLLAGGSTSTVGDELVDTCRRVQSCKFVCDPPQGPDDIYHCHLDCKTICIP
jgi:hypothetical protein